MNILKSFGVYTVAGMLGRVASFLLLPFFTHYLSKSDYGLISIFSNSIFFITPFMAVGIGETFSVEYPRFSNTDMRKFVSSSFIFPFTVFGLSSVLLAVFGHFFEEKTGLSQFLLFLVVLLSVFNFFTDYILIILRNENKPVAYASFSLARTVLELFLAVLFIKFLHEGATGRINSVFYSSLFGFLFVVAYLVRRRLVVLSVSKEWISIILRRGIPAIPLFFMIFILGNADKYVLNYYYGKEMVGLYGLGWQFAMVVAMLINAFMTPFYPFLYQRMERREYDKIIKSILLFLGALAVCSIGFLVVLPFVFDRMIATTFHRSLQFVPYMLLGQFFWAIFLVVCGFIYYKRKNNVFYTLCPAVIVSTILINYLFLVKFPVQNFALVSFLSYLTCFLLQVIILRKEFRQVVPVVLTIIQSFIEKKYQNITR